MPLPQQYKLMNQNILSFEPKTVWKHFIPLIAQAEIDCGPDHNFFIEILSYVNYTIGENKKLFYAIMLMRCRMNLVERGIFILESINKNSHIIALDRFEIYRHTWNETIYPSREIFECSGEVSEDGQQIRFYINQADKESEIYTRASYKYIGVTSHLNTFFK